MKGQTDSIISVDRWELEAVLWSFLQGHRLYSLTKGQPLTPSGYRDNRVVQLSCEKQLSCPGLKELNFFNPSIVCQFVSSSALK